MYMWFNIAYVIYHNVCTNGGVSCPWSKLDASFHEFSTILESRDLKI